MMNEKKDVHWIHQKKLIEAEKIHILGESSHFYPAANHLKMATSMRYLLQMYFITNHVTTSLHI